MLYDNQWFFMIGIPQEIQATYGALLVQQNIPLCSIMPSIKSGCGIIGIFVISITLPQRNLKVFLSSQSAPGGMIVSRRRRVVANPKCAIAREGGYCLPR